MMAACRMQMQCGREREFEDMTMEQRRVRFSSLGALTRDDLPLAVAVWLDEAVKAPWASKETMKIAGILTTYIIDPEPKRLNLASIEGLHQINCNSARRALGLMSMFGMVSAFSTAEGELRAALRLSPLQMLRILEARQKLTRLEAPEHADVAQAKTGEAAPADRQTLPEPAWTPEEPEVPVTSGPEKADLIVELAGATPQRSRTAQMLRARMAEALRREQEGQQQNG